MFLSALKQLGRAILKKLIKCRPNDNSLAGLSLVFNIEVSFNWLWRIRLIAAFYSRFSESELLKGGKGRLKVLRFGLRRLTVYIRIYFYWTVNTRLGGNIRNVPTLMTYTWAVWKIQRRWKRRKWWCCRYDNSFNEWTWTIKTNSEFRISMKFILPAVISQLFVSHVRLEIRISEFVGAKFTRLRSRITFFIDRLTAV